MAEQPEKIIEIREELLVSAKGGRPIKQTANFIKPILSLADPTPELPTTSLPLRPISLNCTYNGWRIPTHQWISWVDRLHSTYQFIWKRAGIYESILSSKYKIVKNEDLFLGLAERWCCETNTFVFPWGEATITLEDIAILGGYSVLGDSVSGGVDFAETEKKLLEAYHQISRGSSQKAMQTVWMKHFMSLRGDSSIEHEAFLSFWLSRFVLPSFPYDVIVRSFFKIAICLARGVTIALAPVVLASIYRDLSLLKSGISNIINCNSSSSTQISQMKETDGLDDLVMITLWAPLQLVQAWAWERFPEFRPKPKLIEHGEPRLARWHDVNEKEIGNVRPLLQSAGNSFKWRPYCKDVDNLPLPIFYKDVDQWIEVGDCLSDDINSMIRFLRVCELVGMDTIEHYNPNRVAMQFGFDQDVPKIVKRDLMNSDIPKRELIQLAWLSYINPIKNEILHFPSRFYEPHVTLRYLKWIRQGVLARHAALNGSVRKRRTKRLRTSRHSLELRNVDNVHDNSIEAFNIDVKPNFQPKFIGDHLDHLDVPPGFMSMDVGNDLDVPPWFAPKPNVVGNEEDVPPGFTPKSEIGQVRNDISKNPAFPLCVFPKDNERPTTFCVEKRNGYLLKSEANIKKECVYSVEEEKPMVMCGYQASAVGIGLKEESSLKIEGRESSGKLGFEQKSEAVNGDIAQSLAHGKENKSDRNLDSNESSLKIEGRESSGKLGFEQKSEAVNGEIAHSLAHGKENKSDRNLDSNESSELLARIRKLERMVAELTRPR